MQSWNFDPARDRTARPPSSPIPRMAGDPPRILSVSIADDEEVHWTWTHLPDGRSIPTGYTVDRKFDSIQPETRDLVERLCEWEKILEDREDAGLPWK